MSALCDFSAKRIEGNERKLSDFDGKVCLIVNVASECGLTPQYDGLQRLYTQYRDSGLEILGFPCNQFGKQEPGSAAEIQDVCRTNYGVEFPLFEKIEVNGDGRHPLYAWLASEEVGPDAAGDIALLECTTTRCEVFRPEADWFAHSNHARTARLVAEDPFRGPGSPHRPRLVAAADRTPARQVDSAERGLSGLTNVLGTVMNKCRYLDERDGYGSEYY